MLLPQDILPLLLLFVEQEDAPLHQAQLASRMNWVPSALHRSLLRLHKSQLWNKDSNHINRHRSIQFLRYGLPHVFPAEIQQLCRGLSTAQLPDISQPQIPYVWPDETSNIMGMGVKPLDSGFVYLAKHEPDMKIWLDIIEVFRLGRNREVTLAVKMLEEIA